MNAKEERVVRENEELARRMFLIGLLGLPWLWIVNCIYFRSVVKEGRATVALRQCSIVFLIAFTVWLITFQVNWRNWDDAPSYMVYVPEEDETNW